MQDSQQPKFLNNSQNDASFLRLLGAEVKSEAQGTVVFEMPIVDFHQNSRRIAQGGALVSLVEVAMGKVCSELDCRVSALTLDVSFIRPVIQSSTVRALANISHKDERSVLADGYILDEQGRFLVKARGTFLICYD